MTGATLPTGLYVIVVSEHPTLYVGSDGSSTTGDLMHAARFNALERQRMIAEGRFSLRDFVQIAIFEQSLNDVYGTSGTMMLRHKEVPLPRRPRARYGPPGRGFSPKGRFR